MVELGNIDKVVYGVVEFFVVCVEQVKEYWQKVFSKIEEFLELVNEFDNFLMNIKRFYWQ